MAVKDLIERKGVTEKPLAKNARDDILAADIAAAKLIWGSIVGHQVTMVSQQATLWVDLLIFKPHT